MLQKTVRRKKERERERSEKREKKRELEKERGKVRAREIERIGKFDTPDIYIYIFLYHLIFSEYMKNSPAHPLPR